MQKLEADIQQLLNGTQNELPATVSVHIDWQLLTQPELVAKLQGYLEIYEHLATAKAAYGQALQALQGIADEAHAFKVSYGQVLHHVLGKASPNLGSFGISVVERKTPTTETQLLAHAKRLATRKARGTLGKRQKLKIKGADVSSVTVTVTATDVTASATISDKPPG